MMGQQSEGVMVVGEGLLEGRAGVFTAGCCTKLPPPL
jgi:hypothetical protein